MKPDRTDTGTKQRSRFFQFVYADGHPCGVCERERDPVEPHFGHDAHSGDVNNGSYVEVVG